MTNASDSTSSANSEQATYWNDVGGPKWVRYADMLDQQLSEVGSAAIDAARPGAGEAVLDVGCGCGHTTLALGRLVGPLGKSVGIDVSSPMLELARERAANASMPQVTFEQADAQTHPFSRRFDVVYSRFGVMFFDDPTRAFINLRTSMRSGARLSFVCWQSLPYNTWMAVPMMAALKHVNIEMPSNTEAPGPFAFADKRRIQSILGDAGFSEVDVAGHEVSLVVGGGANAERATDFLLDMGPLARVLPTLAPALRATVAGAVIEALSEYEESDGIHMPGAVWIVTAKS